MSNNEETMSYREAMATLFDGCLTAFAQYGAKIIIEHSKKSEEEQLRNEIKLLELENDLLYKRIKT